MTEYYKNLKKSDNEVEQEINKIFKESLFVEDEKDEERVNATKIRRLINFWKNILNKADIDKYNRLFKNFNISNFDEIRALFSENHANIIKEMGESHDFIYEKFSKYMRETIGAKTALRKMLIGIEEERKNKEFPFVQPPNYRPEYVTSMNLVQFG
uniref:Uncharacterized protein n=1 Tax=Meloidogyne hapla TaxID=6305 RepID=A0A1I8BRP8_MELHA